MFELIKNDPLIIDLYNQILKYEDETNGWAYHDFNHALNVVFMVEKILTCLGYESEFIEEAKIGALLHDIGCIKGKDDHALRSSIMANEYLMKKNIFLQNELLVLEAIKSHSDHFETDNIMSLVLILCDKLDIKKNRVAKAGYLIEGMKEMQYIEDVLIEIDNNKLIINFITDSKINKTSLENYYFIRKMFKAIEAFSNKLGIEYLVLFNGERWTLLMN